MSWVLDHLEDLESDFSAIHGIRDMYSLPGPQFFSLAMRMSAYRGVMAARVAEIQERESKKHKGQPVERKSLSEFKKMRGADQLLEHTKV